MLPRVQLLSKVITGKNTIAILDYLRLIHEKGKLSIMGADGETWLKIHVEGSEENNQDVDLCVDMRKFMQSLMGLSGKVVTLEIDCDSHLMQGKYDNGYFSLPFNDSGEYPAPPADDTPKKIDIYAKNLLRAIGLTEFAVANDELRPIMNGIHFDLTSEGMVCVASDGHRLVKYTDSTIKGDNETFSFNLAKKPSSLISSLLQKMDEYVTLKFNDNTVIVETNWFRMQTRLIVGRYPNFNTVIPSGYSKKAVFAKNDVLSALKRISPFGNFSTELTIVEFGLNKMELTSEDLDYSTKAQESVDCENNETTPMKIGLKGSFISQSIQNVPCDKVMIEYEGQDKAIIVSPYTQDEGSEYISIQMPMRLND